MDEPEFERNQLLSEQVNDGGQNSMYDKSFVGKRENNMCPRNCVSLALSHFKGLPWLPKVPKKWECGAETCPHSLLFLKARVFFKD